jgi:hypothetical protein
MRLNQRVLSPFLSKPMGMWSARAIYARLNYVGLGMWHDLLTGAKTGEPFLHDHLSSWEFGSFFVQLRLQPIALVKDQLVQPCL